MNKTWPMVLPSILVLLLAVPTIEAKVSPERAAKLGKELTPLGAIRAGNAEGTIPSWEGGITQPPPGLGYEQGKHHPDPFADDQPLSPITPATVDQYRENLSPGQTAMFKRYPKTWRMAVYPTRRTAAFPQHVYDRAIANATTAELTAEGNGVVQAGGGVPFPIPNNGIEAIGMSSFTTAARRLIRSPGRWPRRQAVPIRLFGSSRNCFFSTTGRARPRTPSGIGYFISCSL